MLYLVNESQPIACTVHLHADSRGLAARHSDRLFSLPRSLERFSLVCWLVWGARSIGRVPGLLSSGDYTLFVIER